MGFYAERIFPWVMDLTMRPEFVGEERRRALQDVAGEVLEISFGTGLNLPHYPASVTSFTALDPSPGMNRLAQRRLRESPLDVHLATLEAERLPFDDERFDAVVSTWTMCTIADVPRALAEVKRVLKPGGKLFFIEHGRDDDPRLQRWQNWWNPAQRIIACGCNTNRDIKALIDASGLRITELHRYFLPKTPKILGSIYRGAALRD